MWSALHFLLASGVAAGLVNVAENFELDGFPASHLLSSSFTAMPCAAAHELCRILNPCPIQEQSCPRVSHVVMSELRLQHRRTT